MGGDNDYGPYSGNHRDGNRIFFDRSTIIPKTAITMGILRPIKYVVVPELTFVDHLKGLLCVNDDDSNKINGVDGITATVSTMTGTRATLKSKQSWSSDDSDGGVLLDGSLITEPPIHNSPLASSLIQPPFSNYPPPIKLRDRSLSPPNNGTSLFSHSTSPKTLHFHRKEHHTQHEQYQRVTPAPFTCIKTRKYMLSNRVPNPALIHSRKTDSDLDNLTHNLQNLHVRRCSGWVYSRKNLRRALRKWEQDRVWMEEAERAQENNRFKGIDMNDGWNRAKINGWQFFVDIQQIAPHFEGGPEMRVKIIEGFNRFNFWSQLEPIEWDVNELKGVFDVVFMGEGLGNSGWARKPGAWWAARRKVFDGHRGSNFLEEIDLWVEGIVDGLDKWRWKNKGVLYAIRGSKRHMSTAKAEMNAERDKRRKRVKLAKIKSEQVMSEEWRAKRRTQEKKAGRWTDATLRMDRMWAEFHWVLNIIDDDDEYALRYGVWPKRHF